MSESNLVPLAQVLGLDNAWLDQLDVGFDFSDILGADTNNSDGELYEVLLPHSRVLVCFSAVVSALACQTRSQFTAPFIIS